MCFTIYRGLLRMYLNIYRGLLRMCFTIYRGLLRMCCLIANSQKSSIYSKKHSQKSSVYSKYTRALTFENVLPQSEFILDTHPHIPCSTQAPAHPTNPPSPPGPSILNAHSFRRGCQHIGVAPARVGEIDGQRGPVNPAVETVGLVYIVIVYFGNF